MDGGGLDSWIPSWAQASIAIGGVVAGIVAWISRNINSSSRPSAEMVVTRSEFTEIFTRETRENREALIDIKDVLSRLLIVQENIARMMHDQREDGRFAVLLDRLADREKNGPSRHG
jgi:hypothetical protein